MAITINGTGTITGISAGGLPDGVITSDDLASSLNLGKILQVVQASTSTLVTITDTAMTDSGLSGSITPSSSSNKVLVIVTQDFSTYRNDPFAKGDVRLVRGSTVLKEHRLESTCQNHSTYGNQITTMLSVCYLDSPATTSAVTYKTQGAPLFTANGGNVKFNNGDNLSTITLLEVQA